MSRQIKKFRRGPLAPDLVRRLPTIAELQKARNEATGDNMNDVVKRIADNTDILTSSIVVDKGFVGRAVSIGTTPVKIIDGRFLRGYILTNPTPATGLTANGTLFGSALRLANATGNSQASPVGVASFKTMSLFLDISASTGGAVKIDAQSQDPLSLNWATSQSDLFGSPSAVGTYYANLGTFGVDKSFAAAFTVSAAGNSTFSLSYVLKDGLPGGSTGLANAIYIGGNQFVNSLSGYPLLEGRERAIYTRPNTEVWAVSLISGGVTMVIFDLQ